MDLQKFGIKFYLKEKEAYSPQDYIPVFHGWIQEQLIPNHLLIDVADYSHVKDGPGIMLIAHEGHFSLDQENNKPGMMYMRRMEYLGNFQERFDEVFSMSLHAVTLLCNKKELELDFHHNLFRFISNDRRLADNTRENQNLFQKEIDEILKSKFSNDKWNFSEVSKENERLGFTVNFSTDVNMLNK